MIVAFVLISLCCAQVYARIPSAIILNHSKRFRIAHAGRHIFAKHPTPPYWAPLRQPPTKNQNSYTNVIPIRVRSVFSSMMMLLLLLFLLFRIKRLLSSSLIVHMMFLWFVRYFIRVFCLFRSSLLLPHHCHIHHHPPRSPLRTHLFFRLSPGIYYGSKYSRIFQLNTHREMVPNDTNQFYTSFHNTRPQCFVAHWGICERVGCSSPGHNYQLRISNDFTTFHILLLQLSPFRNVVEVNSFYSTIYPWWVLRVCVCVCVCAHRDTHTGQLPSKNSDAFWTAKLEKKATTWNNEKLWALKAKQSWK